jgi:hypothetical protein
MPRFFLKLFRRRRLHRDLEAELAFHREMSGAHHNLIPFGNAAIIKEQAFGIVAGTKTITIGEEQQPQLYEPLDETGDDKPRIEFVMRSSLPLPSS